MGLATNIDEWLTLNVELELAYEVLDQNMGIGDVKRVFQNRAQDKIGLSDAQLSYSGNKQVLSLTGQFPDGSPFEFKTAPFNGCPIQKSKQIASDLTMPAPAQIKGLANTLREQLTAAVQRAAQAGESAKAEVAELNTTIDQVDETVKEIKLASADIKSALGMTTNGGPGGPLDGEK